MWVQTLGCRAGGVEKHSRIVGGHFPAVGTVLAIDEKSCHQTSRLARIGASTGKLRSARSDYDAHGWRRFAGGIKKLTAPARRAARFLLS